MRKGIIYCVKSPSGKKYYGRTIQKLSIRKIKHQADAENGSHLYFHNAIRKYGKENMKWEIIEEINHENADKLIDILNEKEIFYINHDDTLYPNGYNLTIGGGNYSPGPSDRKGKSYEELFGKVKAAFIKEKQKSGMIGKNAGKKQTEETKLKRALANTGKKRTKEQCENISRSLIGGKRTEEQRRNISESLKGKMAGKGNPAYIHIPEEIQEKIIDSHINKRWGLVRLSREFDYSYRKLNGFLREKEVYIPRKKISVL